VLLEQFWGATCVWIWRRTLSRILVLSWDWYILYLCSHIGPGEQGNIRKKNKKSYSGQQEEKSPVSAVKSHHDDAPWRLRTFL
jgi:hypothetical protein